MLLLVVSACFSFFFSHLLTPSEATCMLIVCLSFFFIFYYGKTKRKKRRPEARWCLISSDDGWTNIKHYANVNDQINLFYSFLCAGCRVLMVYKYGAWNLFFFFKRAIKLPVFWFSLRSVMLTVCWRFPQLWRLTERRKIIQLLCTDALFFLHADCC